MDLMICQIKYNCVVKSNGVCLNSLFHHSITLDIVFPLCILSDYVIFHSDQAAE